MTTTRTLVLVTLLVLGALLPLSAVPAARGPSTSAASCASAPQAGTSALAGATRGFGLDMTRRLVASGAGANVVTSPLSAELALAMTARGARGATRDAMLRTLGLRASDDVATQASRLRAGLDAASCGALRIAGGVWARQGLPVDGGYRRAIEEGFGGHVQSLDMTAASAPATINHWVSDATAGMIPSLVDRLPANTVLYLVNATTFQGRWQTPFEGAATSAQPFLRADGGAVQAPLMSRTGRFAYGQGDGYQAVALPYAGGSLRMVIVLPAATLATAAFAPWLDGGRFAQVTGSLRDGREGTVELPRFTTDSSLGLTEPLRAAGMGPAFGAGADFSGISSKCGCQVSSVVQKTHLAVDEGGTKASAATGVGMITSARPGGDEQAFRMVVDRPFLVAIEDHASGALLFSGVIGDPTA